MKKMINKIWILLLFSFFIIAASCTQEKSGTGEELKKITVYCEEGLYDMMKPLVLNFDSIDTQGEIILKKSSAFDAMAKFLAGEAQAILLSRDYSHYEDSMMKVFSVNPHTRIKFATDALVFFVSVRSEMDTLTDKQIKEYLMSSSASLKKMNRKFSDEPVIAINSHLSSEYFNLKKYINSGKNLGRKLKMFNSIDSVKNYINENINNIGVGYLSQIVNDNRFRSIAVSFTDSSNKYVFPHVVHQANIAQNLYPYIISHKVYIFDRKEDLPLRFGRFLSKAPQAQKYFNNYGIVPAFAKVKLIEEG